MQGESRNCVTSTVGVELHCHFWSLRPQMCPAPGRAAVRRGVLCRMLRCSHSRLGFLNSSLLHANDASCPVNRYQGYGQAADASGYGQATDASAYGNYSSGYGSTTSTGYGQDAAAASAAYTGYGATATGASAGYGSQVCCTASCHIWTSNPSYFFVSVMAACLLGAWDFWQCSAYVMLIFAFESAPR